LTPLKSAGISYSVEENKNFYQAQEVKDILNLLKLAQNPDGQNGPRRRFKKPALPYKRRRNFKPLPKRFA